MPIQQGTAVSPANAFNRGFVTEYTGLNFPEQAATAASNVIFERIGNVHRRPGIDYEANGFPISIGVSDNGSSTYKWNNAAGDGTSQIVVVQFGSILYFYLVNQATPDNPLSNWFLTELGITSFTASGGSFDFSKECQYSDANGTLFVFHPSCDPFYVTFDGNFSFQATRIDIKIRDLSGTIDNLAISNRPGSLSNEHEYNLLNQGWQGGTATSSYPAWATSSITNVNYQTGARTFTVGAGLVIVPGETVLIEIYYSGLPGNISMTGTVTSYSATTLVVNITSLSNPAFSGTSMGTITSQVWYLNSPGQAGSATLSFVNSFDSVAGVYPSNSDIWFTFKNAAGDFDPADTLSNIPPTSTPAPKGFYILNAFNQDRSNVSGAPGITTVSTTARPTTGCWFQGRVWYSGVNASQQATGNMPYYTWTETIYFSEIPDPGTTSTTGVTAYGKCYQDNDPTSEIEFQLLDTDGGTIVIPGSGAIYKLFPIQNGVLVFAANGIWLITGQGSAGAFTATNYSIVKISGIRTFSGTSFVDVQGLPIWWNEEAIYRLQPQKNSNPYGLTGFEAEPITVTTIQTFYQNIPTANKLLARGTYDSIEWIVKWLYKSVPATSLTDSYRFDSVLCLNTITGAFYTYTLPTPVDGRPTINGIIYVQSPGGSSAPPPAVKYVTTTKKTDTAFDLLFSEETDETNWVDFITPVPNGINYTSSFTTGYKTRSQGMYPEQVTYLNIFLNNYSRMYYRLQGNWDWSISRSSGRWSSYEMHNTAQTDQFSVVRKRHRLSGRGMTYQFTVQSEPNQPFDIIGWFVEEKVNAGP